MLGEEVVVNAMLSQLQAVPESLGGAERIARLDAIATELDTLEREEEALIEAAENEGHEVMRRPDARPEIVIGEHSVATKPYELKNRDRQPAAQAVVRSPYVGSSRK
jgi:hypothetical protein